MSDQVTPMMRQYRRIKAELAPGVILLFRLGDFYEMFFEDAKVAAPILDIALTSRNKVPMCGVPFHALDNYLAKLVGAGKKVAICDQVGDPAAAKGIVEREVSRIVTPGTVTESSILSHDRHNFLAGLYRSGETFAMALLDLSTGLFIGEETEDLELLRNDLLQASPGECIVPSEQINEGWVADLSGSGLAAIASPGEDWTFEYEAARDCLVRHFAVQSLRGFGCEDASALVGAAGGALYYVREELRREVGHIRSFRVRQPSSYLLMDEATCANLDLIGARGRPGASSLLKILDVTSTAMGARKIRDWLLRPLADGDAITARHDTVEALVKDRHLLASLTELLRGVRDMERLIARLGAGTGNGRDALALGQSLSALPPIKELIEESPARQLAELDERLKPQPELVALLERAIVAEPPVAIRDGGVIRDGYSEQLDELRAAATEGRKWLAEYQAHEQNRTGIKNLKVRHNRVFGYYIEVSKGQLGNVPGDYTRKQTLVNAERFITPALKEYENKIFGAQEKAIALEQELFAAVRDRIVAATSEIQSGADALAELDVLAALADRALALRYVRPAITTNDTLRIKNGRHPVIEQMPDAERFVPNDTLLDTAKNQLIIITGPNMAGKSTYIRQVAMIVIMAQMGSFVPADEADLGIVDRVFTRVGASDDLVRGRSTFMVEMQEAANILNNSTPHSLIVLDEIGRGTSTFDGISIAWAVAEYLHNNPAVKAKTLFATHYHELTDLAKTMDGVKNYNVLVREKGEKIVFLRRIVPGAADKSYGIQVARLAGLPGPVIDRAREILANLEEGELEESGQPVIARHRKKREPDSSAQMNLFDL